MTLSEYLKNKKKSLAAFAREIDVTPNAVGHWVSGKRTPRPDVMQKIRDATKGRVTANDFFHGVAK